VITNTLDLNIPTHTDFCSEVGRYLQTFVVVHDGEDYVEWESISFQYQFLCRAVYLSLDNRKTLRTYYKHIFAQYTPGDFKRSGIRLLELSKAVNFNCKREFVLYRVAPHIVRHVLDF